MVNGKNYEVNIVNKENTFSILNMKGSLIYLECK